jgi:hypothetical protein
LLVTAVAAARPETLRFYLGYVWAWIPAGACVAVVVYLVRFRRRSGGWSASAQVVVLGAIALAIIAAQQYDSFLIASTKAQPAVYLVPLAALFLVRLHMEELGRGVWIRRLGALWLAFIAIAVSALLVKDARKESTLVNGPGGSIAATRADAAVYTAAVRWIDRATPYGAAILVAPQLTWLYSLSDRIDPLPQISLLPARSRVPQPSGLQSGCWSAETSASSSSTGARSPNTATRRSAVRSIASWRPGFTIGSVMQRRCERQARDARSTSGGGSREAYWHHRRCRVHRLASV